MRVLSVRAYAYKFFYRVAKTDYWWRAKPETFRLFDQIWHFLKHFNIVFDYIEPANVVQLRKHTIWLNFNIISLNIYEALSYKNYIALWLWYCCCFTDLFISYRAVFTWFLEIYPLLVWFCITTLRDWLKKLAPLFFQSEVKPKPIVTRMRSFSRASRQLHTSNFDRFTWLFASFAIAKIDRFLWLWAFDCFRYSVKTALRDSKGQH